MVLNDEEIGTITAALKHFHKVEFQPITDYTQVINNRTEVIIDLNNEEKILYKYDCPAQTIYLDQFNYPFTIDHQYIINDEYYYDFNEDDDDVESAGTYTYINTTEWTRTPETESWMYVNQE